MLFPGLIQLTVYPSPFIAENAALFLHPGLLHVEITLCSANEARPLSQLFEMIADRTGGITTLKFYSHHKDAHLFEKELINVLLSQRNLTSLCLPRDSVTTPVLLVLKSMKVLGNTQFYNCCCVPCLKYHLSQVFGKICRVLFLNVFRMYVHSVSLFASQSNISS